MCLCDETGAKSLLDDEIFVATGRMSLSAKAFGDVGGGAPSGAVCVSVGVRVGLLAGRLCARGAPTAWRDPKDGYDVGGVRRICGART